MMDCQRLRGCQIETLAYWWWLNGDNRPEPLLRKKQVMTHNQKRFSIGLDSFLLWVFDKHSKENNLKNQIKMGVNLGQMLQNLQMFGYFQRCPLYKYNFNEMWFQSKCGHTLKILLIFSLSPPLVRNRICCMLIWC